MRIYKNIILILSISFFVACTPQIRFSSNSTLNKITESRNKKSSSQVKKAVTGIHNDTKNLKSDFEKMMNLSLKQKEVINFAENWVGTPYCYGGTDKNCTDCSGFVMQIFDEAGVRLPRTAQQQYDFGKFIEDNDISPGDLVFFIRDSKIGHVGIYIGNNEFIHASTNKGVIITDLDDDFYRQTFAGVRRVL